MAEDVYIKGLSGVDQWATEDSMKDLLKKVGKLVDITENQKKALEKSIKGEEADSDEIASLLKNVAETNKKTAGATAKQGKQTKTKAGSKPTKLDKGMINNYLESMLPKEGAMSLFTIGVKRVTKDLDGFSTAVVTSAAVLTTKLTQASLDMVSQYAQLYKSGVVMQSITGKTGQGLSDFAQSALDANLTISELASVSAKHSRTMNVFGIKAFGQATKEVTSFGEQIGLTATETSSYLAEYLEQQRLLGTLEKIDADSAARAVKEQIGTTKQFATAMGMSIDQLQERMKGDAETVDMAAALANMSDSQGKLFLTATAGMGDFEKQLLMQMAAIPSGLESGTQAYQELVSRLGPAAAESMVQLSRGFKDGTITHKNAAAETAGALNILGSSINANKDIIQQQTLGHDAFAKGLWRARNSIVATATDLEKVGELDVGSEEIAKASARLTNAQKYFTDFFGKITAAFTTGNSEKIVKLMDSAATALVAITDVLVLGVSKLSNLLSPVLDAGISILDDIVSSLAAISAPVGEFSWAKVFETVGELMSSQAMLAFIRFKTGINKMILNTLKIIGSVFSGKGSLIGKVFSSIFSFAKPLVGFLSKIPGVGLLIGTVFGFFEGIGKAFQMEGSPLEKLQVVLRETLDGLINAVIGLPALLLKGLGSLFLGPGWSQAVDEAVETLKGWINPFNWFGGDKLGKKAADDQANKNEKTTKKVDKEAEKKAVQQAKAPTRTSVVVPTTSPPKTSSSQSTADAFASGSSINSTAEAMFAAMATMADQSKQQTSLLHAMLETSGQQYREVKKTRYATQNISKDVF